MKRVRVLLIEDDPGDARLIREMIKEKKNVSFELEWASSLKSGLELIAKGGISVVLLDLGLPDSQGFETFAKIYELFPQLPIIVLSGISDEELAVKAVRKGAQDYLVKDQVNGNLIIRAIRYAIERKQAEEKIKASIKEKEVMLREIHHRVKNNMQIISSLLRLQARKIKNKKIIDMFNVAQSRIKSMALIHESLYRSGDLARINFSDFIKKLTIHLSAMYATEKDNVKLKLDVKNVILDINRAIPCGLIINELVSNSLKHAFSDGRKGEIAVIMNINRRGKYTLVVEDTGIGFPEKFNLREPRTMGLQLVIDLVKQLDGALELRKDEGTKFKIVF